MNKLLRTLLTCLGLFFSLSIYAAAPTTQVTQNTSVQTQQPQQNDQNDFVNQYNLPIEVAPPKLPQQADGNGDDLATAPAGTSPTTSTTNSSNDVQQQLPPKRPYQSIHDKSVWEKLKVQPINKPQVPQNNTTGETNDGTNLSSPEDTTRHNIYK